MSKRFGQKSPEDLARLIAGHPLAWVVSVDAEAHAASLAPLLPVFSPDGAVVELVGHFARANPQVGALRASGRALILFLGPNGYMSPSLGGDPTQAPTWNYASAQFLVDIALTDDPREIETLIRDLAASLEEGADDPWTIEDMGERYAGLARGVVGFRARVIEARPRFKLGQDERDDIFAAMLKGLDFAGRHDLASWMRRLDSR